MHGAVPAADPEEALGCLIDLPHRHPKGRADRRLDVRIEDVGHRVDHAGRQRNPAGPCRHGVSRQGSRWSREDRRIKGPELLELPIPGSEQVDVPERNPPAPDGVIQGTAGPEHERDASPRAQSVRQRPSQNVPGPAGALSGTREEDPLPPRRPARQTDRQPADGRGEVPPLLGRPREGQARRQREPGGIEVREPLQPHVLGEHRRIGQRHGASGQGFTVIGECRPRPRQNVRESALLPRLQR